MSLVPVLLDARPTYAEDDVTRGSLLLLPTADDLLLNELLESVRGVSAHRPVVLTAFEPDAAYESRIRSVCPDVHSIVSVANFRTALERFLPSDALLFVSPSVYPLSGMDLRPLCTRPVNDARLVRHFVAFEAPSYGTKELVQADEQGRVRRIQRYFEPVTWPFPSGVLASLVPVACAQMTEALDLRSLEALRMQFAATGVPNQDVPFHGDCFNLDDEAGVLAFSERRVVEVSELAAARDRSLIAASAVIHPTARLVGAVVVRDDVQIDAGALVIGPSTIGDGAIIGEDAVVAQCLVLPGTVVDAASTVRHRVVCSSAAGIREIAPLQRRHGTPHLAAAPSVPTRAIPGYVSVKAVVEPVVAFVALLLLSPLILVIAALVKLTSAGPAFYGDSREGKDATPFKCWKFRSMLTNADLMQRDLAAQQQLDGPQFKMVRDPRVTRVGHWLRTLNIDELPQLWNVVRGEMSFVGPRPSPFRENQICVPWRNGRLSVRPGITGLWQVCRRDRATGDFHQWIHYDLLYVRNVSFRLDAMILAATVFTLGGRRPVPLRLMLGKRAPARPRRVAIESANFFPAPVETMAGTGAR